jgi:hypothetical protein
MFSLALAALSISANAAEHIDIAGTGSWVRSRCKRTLVTCCSLPSEDLAQWVIEAVLSTLYPTVPEAALRDERLSRPPATHRGRCS